MLGNVGVSFGAVCVLALLESWQSLRLGLPWEANQADGNSSTIPHAESKLSGRPCFMKNTVPSTSVSGLKEMAENRDKLLRRLMLIRAGDIREERLLRQGRGWIHIPGQGHEALAALASSLEADDLLFLYYRDRALMQA